MIPSGCECKKDKYKKVNNIKRFQPIVDWQAQEWKAEHCCNAQLYQNSANAQAKLIQT